MKVNLATKITILRILLIPFFIGAYLAGGIGIEISGVIFIVASCTDFLDGYLARSRNEVSTLGIFLDPLADKLLTLSALILLVYTGETISVVAVIIILSRENIINAVRFMAAKDNIVISASQLGKLKTIFQMTSISLILIGNNFGFVVLIGIILFYVSLTFTIISGVEYVYNGRALFTNNEK